MYIGGIGMTYMLHVVEDKAYEDTGTSISVKILGVQW